MNLFKKSKSFKSAFGILVIAGALLFGGGLLVAGGPVYADATPPAQQPITNTPDPAATSKETCSANKCDLVTKYLNPLIALLSGIVGLAVVISIIYGAIQYSASGGDPQRASAGKNRIRNALIGLVAYLLLFALMQFIVPGGFFNG
jgi:hypothetical protein